MRSRRGQTRSGRGHAMPARGAAGSAVGWVRGADPRWLPLLSGCRSAPSAVSPAWAWDPQCGVASLPPFFRFPPCAALPARYAAARGRWGSPGTVRGGARGDAPRSRGGGTGNGPGRRRCCSEGPGLGDGDGRRDGRRERWVRWVPGAGFTPLLERGVRWGRSGAAPCTVVAGGGAGAVRAVPGAGRLCPPGGAGAAGGGAGAALRAVLRRRRAEEEEEVAAPDGPDGRGHGRVRSPLGRRQNAPAPGRAPLPSVPGAAPRCPPSSAARCSRCAPVHVDLSVPQDRVLAGMRWGRLQEPLGFVKVLEWVSAPRNPPQRPQLFASLPLHFGSTLSLPQCPQRDLGAPLPTCTPPSCGWGGSHRGLLRGSRCGGRLSNSCCLPGDLEQVAAPSRAQGDSDSGT